MSNLEQLDRHVASAFYGRFPQLRPAQEATIEPLLTGKNIVLSSGTGSGKTEAVLAPLVSRYWRHAIETEALTLLYVAPTKALVNDLEKRLAPPLEMLGLRVGVRHGDRDDLTLGSHPHLLITTPESLDVLLFRKDAHLDSIRAVVIDEVHLLYNTQRGLHLAILLRRLQQHLDGSLQWAALSATIGRLLDVQDFLFGPGEEAIFLQFSANRSIDAHVRCIPTEVEFLDLIRKLTSGRPTKLLIFANARRECERLASVLQREEALRPVIFAHYSSLSPEVRVETEQQFSALPTAICIATSTLELGIDIGDIDAVILWGVPHGVESFLQRIGRGNRRADKTNVICLIPDTSAEIEGDALRFLALIDAAKQGELPIRSPYDLFGAVGQQCLSFIGSEEGRFIRIADLCKLFEHKSHLERYVVELILAELAEQGYLQPHGFKNQYGADEKLHTLIDYRMIYGNFGAGSQTVEVYHGTKVLGAVPAINLLRMNLGSPVRFAGKSWRVRKASIQGIFLEPLQQPRNSAIDFTYPGNWASGSDCFLTNRIWQIIHSDKWLAEFLAPNLRETVSRTKNRLQSLCTADQIPYFHSHQGIRYFTFAGYLVNKAVALITKQTDFKANDISLSVSSPINWQFIPSEPQKFESVFHLLFEASGEQSIYQQLLPMEFQLQEFLQDWLKDETIPQVLTRLANSKPVKLVGNVWSTRD